MASSTDRPNQVTASSSDKASATAASAAYLKQYNTPEAEQAAANAFLERSQANDAKAAGSAASADQAKADDAKKNKDKATAGRLYFITDFKCEIAKVKYAVMTVVMSMQDSGIPTVVLTIDPKPNPSTADISSGTIDEFAAWQSALQSKANTPEGLVSLSFTIKGSEDTGDSQQVDLKDWPMTQVGFGNIAATGGFNTYVVMQHPIYKATTAVLAMMNTYYDAAEGEELDYKDDTAAMILESMDKYLKQKDPNEAEPLESESEGLSDVELGTILAVDKKLHAKAVKALGVLKDNLEWGGSAAAIPFLSIVDDFKQHMAEGGLAMDTYLLDSMSPYDTFMAVAGQMMLMSYGTFTNDKIKIRPMEPWKTSDFKITIDELSQIDLPAYSINPISGVAVVGYQGHRQDVSNAADGDVHAALDGGAAVVQCGYLDLADKLEGYVAMLKFPEWISDYAKGDPAGPVTSVEGNVNNPTAINTGGSSPAAGNAEAVLDADVFDMLKAYCRDEFWRRFRADVSTSMGLRLMITKAGKPMCPGMVADLVSTDGKTILTCYIVSVQHTISVQDAQAYTSITGSYVRGGTGVTGVYDPKTPVVSAIYSQGPAPKKPAKSKGSAAGAVPAVPAVSSAEAYDNFIKGTA